MLTRATHSPSARTPHTQHALSKGRFQVMPNMIVENRTPFPKGIGPLYFFGTNLAAKVVKQGKGVNYLSLSATQSVVPEDFKHDKIFPKEAFEKYLWTQTEVVSELEAFNRPLIISSFHPAPEKPVLFQITPNRIDGIWLLDNFIYNWTREGINHEIDVVTEREEIPDYARLRSENDKGLFKRAKTLRRFNGSIPEHFLQTVFLFSRRLDADEVKVVSD